MKNKSDRKSQEPSYDFTHMWDIKLKATNEQIRQTKNYRPTTVWWLPEEWWVGGSKGWRTSNIWDMVMEKVLTLGGAHTM